MRSSERNLDSCRSVFLDVKTKFIQSLAISALAALVLAGCGGSGTSATGTVSNLKSQVIAAVQGGFSTQNTASSQSSGGRARSSAEKPNRSNTQDPVFNTAYDLWSVFIFDATGAGTDYFVDQALTQPAGTERKNGTADQDGTVRTLATLDITAGKWAGLSHKITSSYKAPVFTFSFEGKNPDGSKQDGTGTFSDGVGEYNTVDTDPQGVRRSYRATFAADGSSRVTYDSPSLFQYTLEFKADRSGTGTVTGNNILLPATITWDVQGNGSITFADLAKVNFTGFDFNQI